MSNQIPDFFPKLPVLANRMKGEAIVLLQKVKY